MTEPIYDVRSFWELLEKRASATPDRPMLIDAADRRVTFAEFKAWAERVAAGFRTLGIGEDSSHRGSCRRARDARRIVRTVALGAIQNPIIQIYRDREVGFLAPIAQRVRCSCPRVAQLRLCRHGRRLSADLPAPPKVIVAYDSFADGDTSHLAPASGHRPSTADAPINGCTTRWPTSDPKARSTPTAPSLGRHRPALKLDMQPRMSVRSRFRTPTSAAQLHVVMMLTHAMPGVLARSVRSRRSREIYTRHDVTDGGGSTAFYISFINEQRKQPGDKIIPTLRILSGGGAPKPPELFLEVGTEIGAKLCHGYGMTECPMIAQGGPRDSDDQLMYSEGGPVEGCVISIIREDGSLAKPDEVGEVRLAGPMLLKGYRDEALNADAFDDEGRFRTGDIGFLRPDGYITLTGRLKDVIIRKGENISAKEVEDILYTHPKVGDCAVIGLVDRERGERVCASSRPRPGRRR